MPHTTDSSRSDTRSGAQLIPGASTNAPVVKQHTVSVGARRVRYATVGEGPPLVLCHGFLGSGAEFCERFAALGSSRTLIVPDLPGSAGAPPLRGRHTAEAMASVVDGLLHELDISRFDLGGLCLGGGVACALANRRPDDVDHLLLHTPLLAPGLVRRSVRAQIRVYTTPGIYGVASRLARSRRVSDLWKRLFAEGTNVDRNAQELAFASQLEADPRAARDWLLDGVWRDDRRTLRARHAPTLIIVAGDDKMVDVRGLVDVVSAQPDVRVLVDHDSGHGWTPAAVKRQLVALAAFLDDRSPPDDPELSAAT